MRPRDTYGEPWPRYPRTHGMAGAGFPGCGCALCAIRDVGALVDAHLHWDWPA